MADRRYERCSGLLETKADGGGLRVPLTGVKIRDDVCKEIECNAKIGLREYKCERLQEREKKKENGGATMNEGCVG